MAQTILIKRTAGSGSPGAGSFGEIAYSATDNVFYVHDGTTFQGFASLASPALTGTPTAPTATAGDDSTQIATTAFVQNAIEGFVDGISYKEPVRVASTANVAIATDLEAGDTIDGVTLVAGDRVLLKDQTTASENGIYVAVASGAASRSEDANTSLEVKAGMTMFVNEGTANADSRYTLTTDDPIVLDTTDLTFTKTSGSSGTLTAGDGIDIISNVISVDVSDLEGDGIEDDGSNNFRVKRDVTTGATVAAVSVGANGVGVSVDNSSILHSSNTIEVGTVDGGTY